MPLTLIVARAANGVIGQGNRLPWHVPEDLKHFKQTTTGHPIIMGRKTWVSLGKPLPNRQHFVVSKQGLDIAPEWRQQVQVFASLEAALEASRQSVQPTTERFVIGGAQVFNAALPYIDGMIVTQLPLSVPGDVYFNIPPGWTKVEQRALRSAEGREVAQIERYRRG